MNPKTSESIEGLIMGITSFIIFLDFMSIDSYIFNISPPAWAVRISSYFNISPLLIDILITMDLIVLILMLGTERKIGGMRQ